MSHGTVEMTMAGLESSKFTFLLVFVAVLLLYKFLKSQHEQRVCTLKGLMS